MRIATWCLIAAVLVAGCGKKSPAEPTPTITSVSMSLTGDFFKMGAQQQLTLTASLSDGTSRTVTGTWSSDAPGVATVAGGLLIGVSPGEATISGDYEGRRATRRIRVTPDFGGTWAGGYRVTNCTDSGAFVGICNGWTTGGIFLDTVFTQNNAALTGTVQPASDLIVPVQGSIAMDGVLTADGSVLETVDGLTLRGEIVNWNTRLAGLTQMIGTFTIVMTAPNFPGAWTMQCEILDLTRIAAQPQSVRQSPAGGIRVTPRILDALRRPSR